MQSGRQNVVGYYFDNKQSPGRLCHLSYSEQGCDLCGCCSTRLDSSIQTTVGWRWVGKLQYKSGRALNSSLLTAENPCKIVVRRRLKRHRATMIPSGSICIYPIPLCVLWLCNTDMFWLKSWSQKMLFLSLGTVFGGKTDWNSWKLEMETWWNAGIYYGNWYIYAREIGMGWLVSDIQYYRGRLQVVWAVSLIPLKMFPLWGWFSPVT